MLQWTRVGGRWQVPDLASRHSRRVVYALFVLTASGLSIGTITALAYWTGHPFVVPSLGPTAFLVFNRSQSPAARPRNIISGHVVGALAGYVALVVFGLQHAPSVVQGGGLTPSRIGAAALSIGLTTAAMILLRVEHGPAGATTLIVSLGFITTMTSLGVLMAGVVALAAEGVLIDRVAGLPLPYWSGEHARHTRPLRLRPASHNGSAPSPAPASPAVPGSAPIPAAEDGLLIGPGQGRGVDIGAEHCTVKVETAKTDGAYSLLEVVLEPGVPARLPHTHYAFSETYVVVEGTVRAEVGDRSFRAGPGSVVCVPPGLPHALDNAGRVPARCLCITPHAQQSEPEFLP